MFRRIDKLEKFRIHLCALVCPGQKQPHQQGISLRIDMRPRPGEITDPLPLFSLQLP